MDPEEDTSQWEVSLAGIFSGRSEPRSLGRLLQQISRATGDSIPAWTGRATADDSLPSERPHLAVHDRHLIAINERDQAFVNGEVLAKSGLALSRSDRREKIAKLA